MNIQELKSEKKDHVVFMELSGLQEKPHRVVHLAREFSELLDIFRFDEDVRVVILKDEGKAIFMSTHDVFRAKAIADRVGIMKDGQLVALKTRAELEGADLEKIYIEYMKE